MRIPAPPGRGVAAAPECRAAHLPSLLSRLRGSLPPLKNSAGTLAVVTTNVGLKALPPSFSNSVCLQLGKPIAPSDLVAGPFRATFNHLNLVGGKSG